MTSSNEEPQKAPKIKLEPSREPSPKPQIQSNSAVPKNKSLMATGAFIIALGALATALYTLSLNQQVQNQIIDKNNQLATQLEQLAQKEKNTQNQIETKNNNVEETKATLQTKFDELNQQVHAAISQRFYQNQNWLLLKVRYTLQLAQINAHWSNNFSSTVALLQQADQLLQQVNAPKVFDIRQAIAKDVAQLQAVPKVDVAGVLSQLDAAQNSLNDLSIPATLSENKSTAPESPTSPTDNTPVWRLRLQDSMSLLNKLVVIRRNDDHIKPLISPAFEALLKENIRLNLQEAQWAVLNHNPQVYQLVLNQAITLLKKNFNERAQNTAALIKKLGQLQQIELTQKRPEIGLALPLLNQLIDSKEPDMKQPSDGQGGNSQ